MLNQIKTLIFREEYDQALELIKQFEGTNPFEALIFRSIISNHQKKHKIALQLAEDAWKICDPRNKIQELHVLMANTRAFFGLNKLDNVIIELDKCEQLLNNIDEKKTQEISGDFYYQKGMLAFREKAYQEALSYYQTSFEIYTSLNSKIGKVRALDAISWIYRLWNDLDKALLMTQQYLKLMEEIGSEKQIASTKNYLGFTYYYNGMLDQALRYHTDSNDMYKKIGEKLLQSVALAGMADIYRCRSDYDTAIEYYKRAVNFCESLNQNNFFTIRYAFRYLGKIYYEKNEMNIALKYYEKSLELSENAPDYGDCVIIAHQKILILLEKTSDHNDEINRLLQNMMRLSSKDDHPSSKVLFKLSRAIVLKNQSRAKSKFEAQILFEEITRERTDFEIVISAMLNLCDLLLDELLTYGEQEVLEEIKELLRKINEIAEQQRSLSIIVDLLILQARLSLIEGFGEKSDKILTNALQIAEKKGIKIMVPKIMKAKNDIILNLEKWGNFLVNNDELRKDIEQNRIAEYLTSSLKLSKKFD
ncbi:MAG: tetratricopeptide repeat protein [Candidatus Hodarchaeales archaeon]|jgi:tetratricopeptide (TPR) repeat protein